MAEKTEIAWTDSTYNPWWGCSKVGPGCDHCYAEALDRRTGGDHWGATKTPRTMSADNWRKPERWQRIGVAIKQAPVRLWDEYEQTDRSAGCCDIEEAA